MNVNDRTLYQHIGRQLRLRRRAVHLTQEQLAHRLGLTRTSITNIEAGLQKLPLHLLYRFCAVLELDIARVLPQVAEVTQDNADTAVDRHASHMPPKTATLVRHLLEEES